MMARTRYVVLVLFVILGLHFILSISHEGYGEATSLTRLTGKSSLTKSEPNSSPSREVPESYRSDPPPPSARKANATIVILARNSDLKGILKSMRQLEDRFNKQFQYPYTFLNEVPFSDQFKEGVSALTTAPIEFGLIPHDDWFQPDWIDEDKATKARETMVQNKVIYGGSVPYRNMCRYNSGFFYRHPLMMKYRYYWRIDPDVTFYCDLDYDPLLFMEDSKKVYGFNIALPEYGETITTLWDTVKEFINENPDLIPKDNGMQFISDDNGETYNRCHFWSNFEIADMDFWRAEAYSKYFDALDAAGGFYYERWGDAPVHSIGAALLAPKDKLHFFNDIGYRHEPFEHCPMSDAHKRGHCWCTGEDNFDYHWYSCLPKYDQMLA